MAVFAQKSFEINLPPAHCCARRRKPHVNQHRVQHRLQIVYILSRVANGIEFGFLSQQRSYGYLFIQHT